MWILKETLTCGAYILLLILLGIAIKIAWQMFRGK